MRIKRLLCNLFVLIAALANIDMLDAQSCPSGLVAYWKLNETSGTSLSETVAGRNATRNSTTGNVSGKVENSQRFTYTVNASNNAYTYSEYAQVPHNAAFDFPANSSFTITYWFRFTEHAYGFQDHIIISKGDWNGGGGLADGMFASGANGSGKINFLLRDKTGYKIDLEGPDGYGNGQWHHVACVRDESTNRNILYVDGVITDQQEYNYTGSFSTAMDLQFGNLINGGNHQYCYKGDVDEIAIFNRALSAAEISSIISNGNSGIGICSVTNQSPSITSTAITAVNLGEAYSYDVQATGTPSSITYSLTTAPSGMTINASTGLISWTPAAVGSFAVTVRASNGVNPDATQSFNITVSGTNPTITSVAVTTASIGEAYAYTVHATGTQTGMVYSLVTAPSGMTINSTSGAISWTPSSVGDFSVSVKASNGVLPDATQNFTISVAGTNPTITSVPANSASIYEPYTYTVHATGTQAGMTYSLVTSPAGMSINATSGAISWTPDAIGSFNVEVKADNGIDPDATQSFTITVSGYSPNITSVPVTDAFVGVLYSYTVQADGTETGMEYSLTSSPAGMTINATSGLISWTPTALGDYDVVVVADNGIEPADEQSFSISVIEPTNCPDDIISLHRLDEAAGPNYADFYDEHNAVASVSANDTTGIIDRAQYFNADTKIDIPDNGTEFDWLSKRSFSFECWVRTSNTAEMVIVGRNRTDYVAARWFVGTNSSGQATFQLRDNGGPNTVVSGTSVITDGQWHHVVAVRDGGANLNKIFVDGVEEASVSYSYTFSFRADNPLVVTLGYLKGDANERHFIGTIDEVAIFNRAITSSEVVSFYNNGIPSGHCRGSNNFPVFTSTPSTSVNEDISYAYTATVNDDDAGDVLTISAQYKPSWLSFNWTAGQKSALLTGTPSNANVGDNDVILRVSDGVMSRDQIFRINVNNVNDAPVKTSTPVLSVNEGSAYSYVLTVNDVDEGDVVSMSAVSLPSWLTFTWTPGTRSATISGVPADENVGANSIDISITDGEATIHEAYTLTVIQVNTAPVITGQSTLNVNEDNSITIQKSNLTITDPDNPDSEITITVQAGANYTFNGNTVTPAANFNGQLSVGVVASDLSLSSQAYPVIITVNAVNDAPVITGQNALSVNKGGSLSILKSDLVISDVDNASGDITIAVQAGTNYTFEGNTVTPAAGFTGQLNVNVIASDLSASSSSYAVVVSVVSTENEPPVITGQVSLSVNEDTPITLLKNDLTITDPDNPSSDITIAVQAGTNYTFLGNVVTPAANFNGQLAVNVIASDLVNNSQVFHVVITVNPVNDKPVITSTPSLSVTAGNPYSYILEASDVENTPVVKSAILIPAWLSFSPATGTLSGTPAAGDVGQHMITLRVTDGTDEVDLSFTITVTSSTAIEEDGENSFIIFPSPVADQLKVQLQNLTDETRIDIISLSGTIVESRIVPAGTNLVVFDVQHIEQGMYICHIKNQSVTKTARFMIVR